MAPGTTIRSLFERFQVPLDSPKIIFLNGRHAMEDHLLHNGDRIAVFPPIAGG
jgi:molybdopterin converting factor small subunit